MVFQSTLELKEHLRNKQTTLGLKETDMFSLPDVTFIEHKRILKVKMRYVLPALNKLIRGAIKMQSSCQLAVLAG